MSAQNSLAVIPARGGSKRIPRKNIRSFRGRPLIVHTIETAQESGLFEQVVVSTDDDEIASISRDCGAAVPFRRPGPLADDHTPISEVTAHALKQLDPDGKRYERVVQLMANCPLRTAEDIVNSYAHFENTDHDVQLSVFEFGWQNPWWALEMRDDETLDPLFEEMLEEEVRSQDQPPLYCISGAIWWGSANVIRRQQTFHIEERAGWEMPWRRAVDIDTQEDWEFAEVLAQQMNTG
ncbi:cytidylyltransferase domain-containing protein [Salinibacter sp.]|uniref:acylneuraminate cytidylyltransferase family protein n=1 Tax=Salinibacter sp. TaxID=2065818 RepID=UPI0021E86EEC|nr:acylneuraminate cytidylyltransferase family protein [Salinibacter sp.]